MPNVQIKRGLYANLPTTGMLAGTEYFTSDRGTLHVAIDATTKMSIVPALDELQAMPAIDAAADLLLMEDTSQAGRKAKKITFADFKTALNIPDGSTDQATAAYTGGTAGSLFGSDGTDGVLRVNPSLTITPGAANAFGTLGVGNIDCGTF
jgi:hypothetical protein